MNENQLINEIIKPRLEIGKITIWSQGYPCELSDKQTKIVKKILRENNIDFQEISIKKMNEKMASFTKLALQMDTGYSLFPNIYFGKEHIGGYDDFKFCFSISKIKE